MSVNIEKIDRIISEIKREEIELDMSVVIDPCGGCGTAACIMGFYNILEYPNLTVKREDDCPVFHDDYSEQAQSDFGLPDYLLGELFYALNSGVYLEEITSEMAIRALEDVKKGDFLTWAAYT